VFLIAWIAFIFVFVSLAQNKHEYYLLPLYPAAAVLVGRFFARLVGEGISQTERRAVQMMTLIIGLALAVGSTVLGLFLKRVLLAPMSSYALPVVIFVGGFWLLAQARSRYLKRMPVAAIGVMITAVLGYQLIYLPLIEPYRPTEQLCRLIEAHARPTDLVGYYKFAAPSMTFYLKRKIFEVHLPDVIQAVVRSDRRFFCIVRESDLPELEQMLPGRIVILDRRPMLTFRLNALMGSPPQGTLPHILLISNHAL